MLEMAWWDPPSISRTVKRLNLPSEASTRFRRGADWGDNIDRAMRRFIQLAAESGITAVSGFSSHFCGRVGISGEGGELTFKF